MEKLRITLSLLLFLPALLLSQLNEPNMPEEPSGDEVESLWQTTDRDSLLAWQEKVFLHLSDNTVQNKGTIFFKAYLVTGPQRQRFDLSKVLRVELIDEEGAVIKRQYHPITDGVTTGNLSIPKKMESGKYYLQAYTRWMQNYGASSYTKNAVFVGNQKGDKQNIIDRAFEVEVFAEGGSLIDGQRNRLVIRAKASDLTSDQLTGEIVNQNGLVVAEITAYSQGLFTTAFTPKSGDTYQLRMGNGSLHPMPETKTKGYLLQANNLNPDKSRIRVISERNSGKNNLRLVGELDGIRYLDRALLLESNDMINFDFSKKGVPRGIMMLRLLDEESNVLASRPIWIDGDEVRITMTPLLGEQMQAGEYVYQIQVTDQEGNPVEAELALGVRESQINPVGTHQKDANYNSFDFFTAAGALGSGEEFADDRRERFLKDISLLSEIESLDQDMHLYQNQMDQIKYPFEKGLELAGYAYDLRNRLLKKTDIQVMAMSEGEIWVQELKTDAKGRLFLKNLDFEGQSELVFRTKGESAESKLVKVIPGLSSEDSRQKALVKKVKKQKKERVYTPDSWENEDIEGLIDLEEVVINEKPANNIALPSVYGIEPDRVKYQDPERPMTIEQLLLDIPGVFVRGIGSVNPTVTVLSGYGPILWVIDGAPISQATPFASSVGASSSSLIGGGSTSSLIEIVSLVPAIDIERIELLNGANAAVYGSRASGGVFLIYTRTGSDILTRAKRKEAQLVFQGYEPEMDFEEYRRNELKKARNLSNILYWNPNIQTDENGRAVVRFTTPKRKGAISMQISTVTEDGKVGVLNSSISR